MQSAWQLVPNTREVRVWAVDRRLHEEPPNELECGETWRQA